MSDTDLIPTLDASPTATTPPQEATQAMQGQAEGMIAMDVESFSNGFMQIMLAGIGWASAEIAKTEGSKGTTELKTFTENLSTELPLIIQNITAASKGAYTPPASPHGSLAEPKKRLFSK